MDDWYKASDFKQDQLLDELMCEYVDGTMDPSVRSAFDELVSSNPSIAKQVEGLSEAQNILQQTGCSLCAPRQFQSRLRARLDAETGKIHVYGLPDNSHWHPAAIVRYSFLVVIFLWTGLALPRHDAPTTTDSEIASNQPVVQIRDASTVRAMTPAQKPSDISVQQLAESNRTINVDPTVRVSSEYESSELELTLLAD